MEYSGAENLLGYIDNSDVEVLMIRNVSSEIYSEIDMEREKQGRRNCQLSIWSADT